MIFKKISQEQQQTPQSGGQEQPKQIADQQKDQSPCAKPECKDLCANVSKFMSDLNMEAATLQNLMKKVESFNRMFEDSKSTYNALSQASTLQGVNLEALRQGELESISKGISFDTAIDPQNLDVFLKESSNLLNNKYIAVQLGVFDRIIQVNNNIKNLAQKYKIQNLPNCKLQSIFENGYNVNQGTTTVSPNKGNITFGSLSIPISFDYNSLRFDDLEKANLDTVMNEMKYKLRNFAITQNLWLKQNQRKVALGAQWMQLVDLSIQYAQSKQNSEYGDPESGTSGSIYTGFVGDPRYIYEQSDLLKKAAQLTRSMAQNIQPIDLPQTGKNTMSAQDIVKILNTAANLFDKKAKAIFVEQVQKGLFFGQNFSSGVK